MVGVEGLGELLASLARVVPRLAAKMRRRHADMGQEMVDLARSRVPVDTGRLQNSIVVEEVGDGIFEFRASAEHGAEDYSRDIEFGHSAGGPVAADDDWFEGRAPRAGAGAAPHPFFFNSAEDVLAKHGHELRDVVSDAGLD